MFFQQLHLKNFRNFSDVCVRFSPRLNIFVGDNGQGKTNLLEAMYLLCQGDSFRYGDYAMFIRNNLDQALAEAIIDRKELQYSMKLRLSSSRKSLLVNDKKMPVAEAKKLFPVVLFSPESLASIKEGADVRRALVDELLVAFKPVYADLISEYRKSLKTRNRILKDHLEGLYPRTQALQLLESLGESYFRLAAELTEARTQALREITPELNNAMQYISRDSSVEISVEYLSSGKNLLAWSRSDIDNAIRQRGRELLDAELASGVSLVGPHKHDILFLYNQKDSRFFCSQGQQRALILSFKMAQIVYHRRVHGIYPVLMLDDVLSELDEGKRLAMINFLHEINTQTFLTTTDIGVSGSFTLDSSAVMHLKQGELLTGTQ